ncbi:MAG: ABC transporter permease, partial [Bacteroidales bacterium]|nr:ABC transporter permease [Bacteroidales bacterium]
MIFSYFKYAFRNLLKQRGHTLINLFGLSFSIACVIIIYLYSSGELSFNDFHKNSDRIYRMYSSVDPVERERIYSPFQPAGMADAIKEKVPGVELTCRLKSTPVFLGLEEELFHEHVGFVDSTFFDLFSYEFMAGDRENPLSHPKSVVLTAGVARKIFGDSLVSFNDVIGETLGFPERPPFNKYTVTAVIEDPPENTSFQWSVLIPYVNARAYPRSNDFIGDTYLYVMLDENNNVERLEQTAQTLVDEFLGERLQQLVDMGFISANDHHFTYRFMPYRDLYLQSDEFRGDYELTGNMNAIYILSSIALLILFIACFNYVMIAIGTALNRIGDFGIMNVVGARRWQILTQFVIESFVLTLISMLLGIILAEQILPLFNKLANEELKFTLYNDGFNFIFLLGILLFIVLSTSAYIGIYLLRRSQPLRFLRREMLSVRRNGVARVSVVVQFFIAIAL